jgi:hypothetical protein
MEGISLSQPVRKLADDGRWVIECDTVLTFEKQRKTAKKKSKSIADIRST